MSITIARKLQIEVYTYIHLEDSGLSVPEVLSPEAMRRRYVLSAMEVLEDDQGRPERLAFYDGSVALRDTGDLRRWREVRDGEGNDGREVR